MTMTTRTRVLVFLLTPLIFTTLLSVIRDTDPIRGVVHKVFQEDNFSVHSTLTYSGYSKYGFWQWVYEEPPEDNLSITHYLLEVDCNEDTYVILNPISLDLLLCKPGAGVSFSYVKPELILVSGGESFYINLKDTYEPKKFN